MCQLRVEFRSQLFGICRDLPKGGGLSYGFDLKHNLAPLMRPRTNVQPTASDYFVLLVKMVVVSLIRGIVESVHQDTITAHKATGEEVTNDCDVFFKCVG